MDRRGFLVNSAMAGASALTGGCRLVGGLLSGERVPYGETVGDRLWMWGHHADSFASMKGAKEQYNLPFDRRIDMAAACREMNIPGCFVVRWRNLPRKADLADYMRQFAKTRRVGFSVTDSAVESFSEKARLGLELADRMPNLTTLVMDDFFSHPDNTRSLDEIVRLREQTSARGMKLGIVFYSDANGLKPEFREKLSLFDEITFWFWYGKNVGNIVEQVDRLREMVGKEKKILLGQYMWDFGGKRPMSGEAMECQLGQTSQLLARRAISGVIFHCTPLVDMDLDAVRVSKTWIAANADRRWGE